MVHRKRASSYHPMQMPPLPHLALLLSKLAKPTTLSSSRIKLEIICVHSLPQRRVKHDDRNAHTVFVLHQGVSHLGKDVTY